MRHISEAKNKLALHGLSNDKFIVMEDMTLETRKGDTIGDVKFAMGEEVMLGAEGDNLVVRDMDRFYIVEDYDIAKELINNVVCKEELSDVEYKKMTFLEAKSMRIVTSDLIKAVADTDEIRGALKDAKKRKESLYEMKKEGVALPIVKNTHSLSVADKMKRIFENKMVSKDSHLVEAIEIRENPAFAKDTLMLDNIKVLVDEAKKEHENVNSSDEFMNVANDIEATVDMDAENGEMVAKKGEAVVGVFDTKANVGVIFKAGEFQDAKELKDAMKDAGINLKGKFDFEKLIAAGKEEEVEEALSEFINSDKQEESCNKCKKVLCDCGMSEEIAADVMECFK